MEATDKAIKETIRWHVLGIVDRNLPILSEIEDCWDSLNQAFGTSVSMRHYTVRFAAIYAPLTEISGKQCDLAFVDTYEQFLEIMDALNEIAPKIDDIIASLFKLLAEIGNSCFKRLLSTK